MDAITYAAASAKIFHIDLGNVEETLSSNEFFLSDEQAEELESLIKSGKLFILNLSGQQPSNETNEMNEISLMFTHSGMGFFYSIMLIVFFMVIYDSEQKKLQIGMLNDSSSSSTYSPRSETPTFKELFEMIQESAIERGLIK